MEYEVGKQFEQINSILNEYKTILESLNQRVTQLESKPKSNDKIVRTE